MFSFAWTWWIVLKELEEDRDLCCDTKWRAKKPLHPPEPPRTPCQRSPKIIEYLVPWKMTKCLCFVWTAFVDCQKTNMAAISLCVTWQNIPGFLECVGSHVQGFQRPLRHFESRQGPGDEVGVLHWPVVLSSSPFCLAWATLVLQPWY